MAEPPRPHVLVVGGTGMLAGLCEALAGDGGRLSLLSRRASAFPHLSALAYDCDYHDDAGFEAALDRAVSESGVIDIGVAWFHTLKLPAPRLLAERIGAPGRPGRLFQVLGSATADPSHPERLESAAQAAAGLPSCAVRQVVLGFVADTRGSRWLTDAEISQGVLEAIRADTSLRVVGQVEPWSARP